MKQILFLTVFTVFEPTNNIWTYKQHLFYSATFGTTFETWFETFVHCKQQPRKLRDCSRRRASNAAMKGPGVTWDGGHNSTMIYWFMIYINDNFYNSSIFHTFVPWLLKYMNQCYNMFLNGETCRDVMWEICSFWAVTVTFLNKEVAQVMS